MKYSSFKTLSRSVDNDILLKNIHDCEQATWEPQMQASLESIKLRSEVYSDGFFVAYDEYTYKVYGFCTSFILDYKTEYNSWFQVTDYGKLTKHDPNAQNLYIVSVTVSPDAQGQGVGSSLLSKMIELKNNLQKELIICPRIESGEISIVSIEELRRKPKINFYLKNGFVVKKIYSESDEDIQGKQYGILMSIEDK